MTAIDLRTLLYNKSLHRIYRPSPLRETMVFVVDQGSAFDASLEKIWRYLQTPPDVHNHPANQNVRAEMQPDNSMVMTFENDGPGGVKVTNKLKFTMFPPVGFLTEYIGGPLTGSKMMQYYTPMGDKTGVTVAGEFTSAMVPENQLRPMVLQNLEQAFNDDQQNLKQFK
jgi:hypothetical protein